MNMYICLYTLCSKKKFIDIKYNVKERTLTFFRIYLPVLLFDWSTTMLL